MPSNKKKGKNNDNKWIFSIAERMAYIFVEKNVSMGMLSTGLITSENYHSKKEDIRSTATLNWSGIKSEFKRACKQFDDEQIRAFKDELYDIVSWATRTSKETLIDSTVEGHFTREMNDPRFSFEQSSFSTYQKARADNDQLAVEKQSLTFFSWVLKRTENLLMLKQKGVMGITSFDREDSRSNRRKQKPAEITSLKIKPQPNRKKPPYPTKMKLERTAREDGELKKERAKDDFAKRITNLTPCCESLLALKAIHQSLQKELSETLSESKIKKVAHVRGQSLEDQPVYQRLHEKRRNKQNSINALNLIIDAHKHLSQSKNDPRILKNKERQLIHFMIENFNDYHMKLTDNMIESINMAFTNRHDLLYPESFLSFFNSEGLCSSLIYEHIEDMKVMKHQKDVECTAQFFYFVKATLHQLHKKVIETNITKKAEDLQESDVRLTQLAVLFDQQVVKPFLSSPYFVDKEERRLCHVFSESVLTVSV